MKILLVIVVSIAVFLLSGAYFVFMKAFHREKELRWEEPDGLEGTMWAALADKIHGALRYLKDNNARDVYIRSKDGLKLRARWLPADRAVGSILLFHGYRSCSIADFSVIIPFYHSLGFNLLLVDQRSHGKSEGKFITFGIKEHDDVLRWIDWHNESVGNLPVYLGGMSMGAATVLMAAGRDLPGNVKGVCADCGFTDPYEIVGRIMRSQRIPPFPLLDIAGIYTKVFAGFGLREYSTLTAMKNCRIPVLLIHGLSDDFVPCEMSKRAFEACVAEKQLILVENAGHGTSYLTDPERCQTALKTFLLSHLEN